MSKDRERSRSNKRPAVAGPQGFYPTDPTALRDMIERFMNEAELKIDVAPFGLIAPHAGYVYSGAVAGWAYKQLHQRDYRSVIILAPSHMVAFPFASVMPEGSYTTPLGEVQVDKKLAAELVKEGGDILRASYQGHSAQVGLPAEHSLEVQLPFLQVALGDFKLVPVVLGIIDSIECQAIGAALAKVMANEILLVASSDLSHYHSYDEAYRLDKEVIELIKGKDALRLAEGCRQRKLEACGGMPIASLMLAAKEAGVDQVEILRHQTSGDVPYGSKDQVVCYLAAAFYKKKDINKVTSKSLSEEPASSGSGIVFEPEDKDCLLKLARQALREAVLGATSKKEIDLTIPVMQEYRGLFVTLKIDGRLRGCIGNLSPTMPLGELVKKIAVQAAFDDPRFPKLTKVEFEKIKLDITILGDMILAQSPDDLVVGRHGVMIRKGFNQGLLLPQVATEMGWDRLQFLEGVCQKADLPRDAWKDKKAQLFIFTADCFGED